MEHVGIERFSSAVNGIADIRWKSLAGAEFPEADSGYFDKMSEHGLWGLDKPSVWFYFPTLSDLDGYLASSEVKNIAGAEGVAKVRSHPIVRMLRSLDADSPAWNNRHDALSPRDILLMLNHPNIDDYGLSRGSSGRNSQYDPRLIRLAPMAEERAWMNGGQIPFCEVAYAAAYVNLLFLPVLPRATVREVINAFSVPDVRPRGLVDRRLWGARIREMEVYDDLTDQYTMMTKDAPDGEAVFWLMLAFWGDTAEKFSRHARRREIDAAHRIAGNVSMRDALAAMESGCRSLTELEFYINEGVELAKIQKYLGREIHHETVVRMMDQGIDADLASNIFA